MGITTRAYSLVFLHQPQAERVLLLQRNSDREEMPGFLNGLGGKLHPGESIEGAAIREVEEEAGVTPLNLQWRGTESWISTNDTTGEDSRGTLFLCSATEWTGTVADHCPEGKLDWFQMPDALAHPHLAPNLSIILPILLADATTHYVGVAQYGGPEGLTLLSHGYTTW